MIKTYVKKPVEVQAIEYTEENKTEIFNWFNRMNQDYGLQENSSSIFIPTLEGEMELTLGNYLICGIQNEFYPCKADIFEASYQESIYGE